VLIEADLTGEAQKAEITKYVQAMETNYTDKLRQLKEKNDRL
jgi:hypothetical protein